MAKRRSWFGWLKKLFICDAKAKPEKKQKKCRWIFRRLKFRQQLSVTAVAAAEQERRTFDKATEEQRKHAVSVAIATAAAAEAAVAAAKAAAEVVRLAGTITTTMSNPCAKRTDPNLAAIKIQSAFRAYLARKALRALKALVRLQAIVRGRAVRRRVAATLKPPPWKEMIQLEHLEENKIPMANPVHQNTERKHWFKPKWELKEEVKLECSSQKSWDCSSLTKEDIEAIWLRKQKGMIKRERMFKYSYSHRERRTPHMLLESVHRKETGLRSCRMEHWGEPNHLNTSDILLPLQVKLKALQRHDSIDGQESPFSFPRRSFSRAEHNLLEDESLVLNTRGFPNYPAVTESAKAKTRSLSTPRQRVGFMDCSWLDNNKGFWSSFDGDSVTSKAKIGNSQQLSVNMNHYGC